ncbi:hypothetical protein StoSoilB5_09490 [Arthrobacter sp. StoSoilB5]|nr:hypothetical protein StoSoilB5_09490 [Arthrobacter sp. StoSoilB5]
MAVATGKILGHQGCSHSLFLSQRQHGARVYITSTANKRGFHLSNAASMPVIPKGMEKPAGPDLGGVRTNGFKHQA